MTPAPTPPGPMPPSSEQEKHVLREALVECRRRLAYYRDAGDALNADLAEADLNQMLERLAALA